MDTHIVGRASTPARAGPPGPATGRRGRRPQGRVEDGAGTDAEAPPRFPSPLIKPDVPISSIRLSDWLHRRLTYARPVAPGGERPPKVHTPVPQGTGGCLARTPCLAEYRDRCPCRPLAEARALPSTGITRLPRYLRPSPTPRWSGILSDPVRRSRPCRPSRASPTDRRLPSWRAVLTTPVAPSVPMVIG